MFLDVDGLFFVSNFLDLNLSRCFKNLMMCRAKYFSRVYYFFKSDKKTFKIVEHDKNENVSCVSKDNPRFFW